MLLEVYSGREDIAAAYVHLRWMDGEGFLAIRGSFQAQV